MSLISMMLLLSLAVSFLPLVISANKAAYTDPKRQDNVTAPPAEAAASREYFYVGGEHVTDPTGGHILQNQMYVEKLMSPVPSPKPHPILFVHGRGQTATNWLNKLDGSPGWASYFLNHGYNVYLVDQPNRGRSPINPYAKNISFSTDSAESVSQRFTAPEKFNIWPQAALHTQWPDAGLMGSSYFDAFYATQVPSLAGDALQQSLTRAASLQLLDLINQPVILVSHSAGGPIAWLLADARPDLVAAIVSLEPAGPPFFNAIFSTGAARPYGVTDVPLTYFPPLVGDPAIGLTRATISPPSNATEYLISNCTVQAEPARKLPNLAGTPVLVVTTEASYHAPYDWCTVAYLRQAGVNTTHLELGKAGVHGNGHMMFLERNSDEIAGLVDAWVGRIEGGAEIS